jgi:hypothetical protein
MQNAARFAGGVFVFGVYVVLPAKAKYCPSNLLLD